MQEEIQDGISLKMIVLEIKGIVKYLRSKWLLIGAISIVGGIIGFIYANNQKIVYSATLTFAVEEEKSGMGVSGIASQFGFDLGGGDGSGNVFAGANLIELMKSRTVIERVLLNPIVVNNKEISLADFYIDIQEWKTKPGFEDLQFKPAVNRINYTLRQDSILGKIYQEVIANNLKVLQVDKKTSFITIEARSINELFSKFLVEVLAEEVSDFYIKTKNQKAKINLSILQHQSDSIRAELNGAISGVASANDNTYNLNPALNIKRVQSSRKQIDVQANTVILTEILKNLEMAKVTFRKETPLFQIIDRPILPLNKQKAGRLKSALLGGFLGGLFSVVFFISRRWWMKNMIF